MMDNIREKLVEILKKTEINKINGHTALAEVCFTPNVFENMATNLIANGVTVQDAEQEKGEWNWKHRHRGGFRKYTGEDALGEKHTITVDERFECYDPYCPACGKLNESIYLNFCPNCGKAMLPSEPPFAKRKLLKGE